MRSFQIRGFYTYSSIDQDQREVLDVHCERSQEFDEVINGRGICNHERLAAKRKAWEEGAWVREAALAHAEKQRARQAA